MPSNNNLPIEGKVAITIGLVLILLSFLCFAYSLGAAILLPDSDAKWEHVWNATIASLCLCLGFRICAAWADK